MWCICGIPQGTETGRVRVTSRSAHRGVYEMMREKNGLQEAATGKLTKALTEAWEKTRDGYWSRRPRYGVRLCGAHAKNPARQERPHEIGR